MIERSGEMKIMEVGKDWVEVICRANDDKDGPGKWSPLRKIYKNDLVIFNMSWPESFDVDQINGEIISGKELEKLDEMDKIRLKELRQSTFNLLNELIAQKKIHPADANIILGGIERAIQQRPKTGLKNDTYSENEVADKVMSSNEADYDARKKLIAARKWWREGTK